MNKAAFVFSTFFCWLVVVQAGLVSFSANGTWIKAENTTLRCDEQFLCTGENKLVFRPTTTHPKFRVYSKEQACEALIRHGVKRINFHGDSYMRQMYSAMIITLRGDFRYGSIADPTQSPQCEYHKQFFEKKCGVLQLNHHGSGCDGRIKLDPLLNGLDNFNECNTPGTISLWSFGNHKISRYGRKGVNNATEYQELFDSHTCPLIKDGVTSLGINGSFESPCSVWWVSTHARLVGHFADEREEQVRDFNYGMRNFFDENKCGPVNYIDVFNMTERLVQDHRKEAETLSYDGVHWGMEVNLMKAQIIINALLSMPHGR